jgi:cyanate lyase
MTRDQVTEQILAAKRSKELSFAEVADRLTSDKVWLTAALLGQHPLSQSQAESIRDLFELPEEAVGLLQEIPMRGSLDKTPPTDPTIYRIYEVLQVYGTAIKALINEEFGDGIMSAISFNLAVEREQSDEGPRVKITLSGKYLPYTW